MAGCPRRLWAAQDAVQSLEAVEVSGKRHWSECGHEQGIFARMMVGLAAEHGETKTVMIDATYLKAHRTATSLAVKKEGRGRLIGRTKGGMNTKLHAICDSQGRPLNLFVTAGLALIETAFRPPRSGSAITLVREHC